MREGLKKRGGAGEAPVENIFVKTAGILLVCLAAAMALGSLYLCQGNDIWYDELFTEGFVDGSVGRLLSLAVRDVHPPLYYLMVKAAVDCAGLLAPAADPVVVSKIMSVVPYLGLLAYSLWLVRKRHGWLCAGVFSFCLMSMPQLSSFTTEVRMYGWALFFVTAAFLHAGEILAEGKLRHWVALVLYAVCAAYTHYFAAVAAACLYLGLAVLLVAGGRQSRPEREEPNPASQDERAGRKGLKLWLAGGICGILSYLPWLPSALSQVGQVRENYWILPLTWSCFGGCVKFVLKPSTGYQWLDYLLAVLLFVLLAAFLVRAGFLLYKEKTAEKKSAAKRKTLPEKKILQEEKLLPGEKLLPEGALYAFCGLWVLAGTALFGILVSVLMRPVFIYRYMMPALGCFWFCFAWYVSKQKKWLSVLSLALLLFAGIVDYKSFAEGELYKRTEMERTQEELARIGEEDVVVFNFDQVQAVGTFYLNQETWLYADAPEELISDMFPLARAGGDVQWLKEQLEEGRTVWFVGSGLAREALLEEWEAEEISVAETVDSCLLERYWFNLYRLELKKTKTPL